MDHSWGYGTDQRLREENQDCHGVFDLPEFTLAVVCDGMGGHVGGAQASALAVRTIHDTLMELQGRPIQQALEQAVERTNLVIYEAARKNHRLMGMGTTAVVAAITDDACYLAHVGDSRAYLLRQGGVQQLTRDHTMVNLFVDAELLSPEDAATHPEAHVLSRSLGVERQVDVELASPIRLEPGDVVFLCSDGVHGVVTDWELANVEWGAPHAGVSHVLSIVATREGDDNASAVSVLMGTSFEDVPATPLPEPRRFDEVAPPSGGVTAVPAEDLGSDHGRHTLGAGNTLGGHTLGAASQVGPEAGYLMYEDPSVADPITREVRPPPEMVGPDAHYGGGHAPTPPPGLQSPQPPGQPPPRTPPPARATLTNRSRRALRAAVPVAIASFMLLVAVAGAVMLMIPDDIDMPPNIPVTFHPEPGDGVDGPDGPGSGPEGGTTDVVAEALVLFDGSKFRSEPRRIPHRAKVYTQPPPGGPHQYEAVEASRRKDCPSAIDAVQRGMKVSIDHATLYKGAWLCFNEAHQRPLATKVSNSWDDFAIEVIPNLEGTPEQRERQLAANPALARLPEWYRPAVSGLEYRLQKFTDDDQMFEVVTDLFGEPKVTDALARDLWFEAVGALGLSQIPPEQRAGRPVIDDAWARRVYVLASALQRRPGRLLDEHWHEMLVQLRGILDEATAERTGPDGRTWRVPAQVLRARRVAEGNEPAPSPAVVKRRAPSASDEIDKQLRDDEGEMIIHRAN